MLEISGTNSHKRFTSKYESAECDLKVNQEDRNAWSWVDAGFSLEQVHTACLEFLVRRYFPNLCEEVVAIHSSVRFMFGVNA